MTWAPPKKCDADPIGCLDALLLMDDLFGKLRLNRIYPENRGYNVSENTLQNVITSLPKVGEYLMIPLVAPNSSDGEKTHMNKRHLTEVYYYTFIHLILLNKFTNYFRPRGKNAELLI